MLISTLIANAGDIIGTVNPPQGVQQYGDVSQGGLILFVSNIIKLLTIVGGIWVLFNFILAGYTYITSQGESSAATKVKDQITSSVIGLIIIVVSYTIIALLSLLLFGDAGFILNPKIPSPL